LSTGKRLLGLVQLIGLSLVPKPPARIKAFKGFPHDLDGKLIFNQFNKTIS
jgi:hypothetical protein